MFRYTKAALSIILNELKKWAKILDIIFSAIMLVYFAYICIMSVGIVYINIALLVAYAVYTIFRFSTAKKEDKKLAAKIYKLFTLSMRGITLASTLYAIYVAGGDANGIAIIMAVLTLLLWVMETLVRLITSIVESKKDLVVSAFYMDIEPIIKAHNFFSLDVDDKKISIREEHKEPLIQEAQRMKEAEKERKKEQNKARIEEIKEKIFHR